MKNGDPINWDQAMATFIDTTGRPGPATWELGDFPDGRQDYPVSGVSWHEAAAYCEFAGKMLPTVYHWSRASFRGDTSVCVPMSNLDGQALAPVGSFQGMARYGTFDMAGNVREWCWTRVGDRRLTLGGAWNEPQYVVGAPESYDPMFRAENVGFRGMKTLSADGPSSDTLVALAERPATPPLDLEPPSEELFQAYRSLFDYDRTDLNAVVESVDDSSRYYVREKVTFDAAYGSERMEAYLSIPKGRYHEAHRQSVDPAERIRRYDTRRRGRHIPSPVRP